MENTDLTNDNLSELEDFEFHEFQINTKNAYHLASIHQDDTDISHKNLVEFRDRLEDVLPSNAQPSAKFHPLHWEYHKSKYKAWERQKDFWRMEDSSVFNPYFFMSDARISGEITYHSLTKEEQKIVDDSAKEKGEDSWTRWGYDSYALWDDCPLTYEKHQEDFEFFFAWQILLTDLLKMRRFLNWHLKNTFQNNLIEFKEFIEIMYIKYDRILCSEKNKQVVFGLLAKMELEPIATQITIAEIVENTIKNSKIKVKDKIEIPFPPKRNKEKWTIFSKDDTIKLFDYLIQLECLISDTKKVSKESIAKAIYAITGYSDNDTAEMFVFERTKPKTKKDKETIVENIKELIIRNLK